MPVGVVTTTGPVVAPVGTIAVRNVSEPTLKLVAGTPLKVIAVVPVKPCPRISALSATFPTGSTKVTNGARPTSKLYTDPASN